MTPKSETMWMAWHQDFGFKPKYWGRTKEGVEFDLKIDNWETWEAIEVTIQPKKRGKG
jgi:hypothetical protein